MIDPFEYIASQNTQAGVLSHIRNENAISAYTSTDHQLGSSTQLGLVGWCGCELIA